jgi:hypothetical protein
MGYQPNKRDKIVVWLSNRLLRLATKEYRALVSEFIRYGMDTNKSTRGRHDGTTLLP